MEITSWLSRGLPVRGPLRASPGGRGLHSGPSACESRCEEFLDMLHGDY